MKQRKVRDLGSVTIVACGLALAGAAAAAEGDAPASAPAPASAAGGGTEKVALEDSSAPAGETAAPAGAAPAGEAAAPAGADGTSELVADAAAGDGAVELPGKTYRFLGARYRTIIIPKFMLNLFAEGGDTVVVHAFGPEFAIRKNGFEYNLSAWLGLYGLGETPFKGKSDPETAWELVRSDLKILYLTSDFLWSHEFSPEFALNYGAGAGLGIVFGDLFRAQSYPTAPGQEPKDYAKCRGVDDPPESQTQGAWYCDDENEHFGNYKEKSLLSGGSKPPIFPWLALQTGLRYKPARSFVGRLDLGFGTSGFFLGLGADYGL